MEFRTIEDLHDFLNGNPIDILNCDDITKIIRNSIEEIDDNQFQLIERFEIERAAYSFFLEKDKLNPKATFVNDEGISVSYPSIMYFDENKINIIQSIFEQTSSYVLSGHLGHFLWNIGKKHHKFLDKSKFGYISIIRQILEINETKGIEERTRNKNYHQINFYLSKLLFVSKKLRKPEEYVEIILMLKNEENHNFMHFATISTMVENSSLFKKDDLLSLSDLCIQRAQEEESYFSKIDFFRLGLRVDNLNGVKSQPWKKLIADQYKILSEERKDLAAIEFANKASKIYQEIGENELSQKMARVYEEKASNKQLSSIQKKVDVTDAVKYYDNIIDKLYEQDLESIISFLGSSDEVVPPKVLVDEIVASSLDYNRLRFYVSNVIYDSNGHAAQHFTTEDEVIKLITLENYHQLISMRFEILISRLLIKMLNREDWNSENFIKILTSKTWFGHPINKTLSSEISIDVKYIDYLSPGINHYFKEMGKWDDDKDNYNPDFTLCIDSLTLKVESLLREICKFNGIQTFYIRHDDKERNVTKEKDINMLLREENLLKFIGEDLAMFLKSIFVERVGNNLRNKVAHSFLYPFEYKNFITINKVIVAILRLAVWKIEEDQ